MLIIHVFSENPAIEHLVLNCSGDVVDGHGDIIGNLTPSDSHVCEDKKINGDNDVIDAIGVNIDHVNLLSDVEQPELEPEREDAKLKEQQKKNDKKFEPGTRIEDQCATWDSAPNSKCYASFGDQGTTASVGAYGHLMQVSQYLEAGRSGMFAMGSRMTDEPLWPVDRAQKLEDMSHSSSAVFDGMAVGLELKIKGLRSRKRQPKLRWVNWRWPRFEYTLPKRKLEITVQWMVRDHTVLQQLIVTNTGNEEMAIPIEFGRDMWIQDLEYMDIRNTFNDKSDVERGQYGIAGPRDYGWVLMHPFDEKMRKATSIPFTTLGSKSGPTVRDERDVLLKTVSAVSGHNAEHSSELEYKIGDPDTTATTRLQGSQSGGSTVAIAVMAVFVNGSARQLGSSDSSGDPWTEKLKGHANLEVTAAYKMILVPAAAIDYRNFLIPCHAANVTQFLMEEEQILLHSLSKIDLGNKHIGADLNSDSLGNQAGAASPANMPSKANSEDAAGESRSSKTVHLTQPASSEEARRIARPSGCPRATSSPRSHIDFAVWRNLEHILSVCAIPLTSPPLIGHLGETIPGPHVKDEMVAVALTCGDFAGHRLYNPASL